MPLTARHYPFGEVKYQSRMVDCYDFHTHELWVISARMGAGELAFDFRDERVEVDADTLVCFPPRQLHRAVIAGEVEGYGILHIEPEWLVRTLGVDREAVTVIRSLTDAELHRRFAVLVQGLIEEERDGSEEVSEWLLDFFEQVRTPAEGKPIPNTLLERVREEIQQHWDAPLHIPVLAESFGLNPYTLIRQFKHHYGSTPKKYQLDLRVHRAKALIAGGMEIAEAALTCGFYDQSHLYNYFKKIFGVSPQTYKKAFEN